MIDASHVRLPPPAGPGDRVGVAALSGPVAAERLEQGLAALRGLGFEPVLADNAASRAGLFAGGDAERLAAFHRLAADPDLPAIMFTRGGHGLLRVLPGIDWELLRRRPRAYVGYSDLTPFLLAVVRRLGLAAFHGPLVGGELARGLTGGERESLLGALGGRYPAEVPLRGWLREGAADGPLLGGCLSLLTATLGTAWFPDLDGAVLFVEDVNEPPYKLDRMLTHLGLSGNLDRIGGMIIGHLDGGADEHAGALPTEDAGRAGVEVIADNLRSFRWPLAWGLDSGHRSPNLTLPVGLPARLGCGGAHRGPSEPPCLRLGAGPALAGARPGHPGHPGHPEDAR
ncbi:MAG: LD-carboxypeptidase [Acidobacteria bacterium]|nr:LD-carboxypeptidase [Acidobacteriota bacterium]